MIAFIRTFGFDQFEYQIKANYDQKQRGKFVASFYPIILTEAI